MTGIPFHSNIDMKTGAKITGLPNAVNDDEAATLGQLKAMAANTNWKDSVRVATTANIDLASAPSSIDTVTLTNGDRVLVKDQTDDEDNGIYVFNGAGVAMSRAADANTAASLEAATVRVEEGDVGEGTKFVQTQVDFTLDTDPVIWEVDGAAAPAASDTTAGISELATQGEADANTGGSRVITSDVLNDWGGRAISYVATFGDGSNVDYTITHGLGTRDVLVELYLAASPYTKVMAEVEVTSTTTVTVKLAGAPGNNYLRAVISKVPVPVA